MDALRTRLDVLQCRHRLEAMLARFGVSARLFGISLRTLTSYLLLLDGITHQRPRESARRRTYHRASSIAPGGLSN